MVIRGMESRRCFRLPNLLHNAMVAIIVRAIIIHMNDAVKLVLF